MGERIVVGLSGGVDSSVAALLLKRAGQAVIVTMGGGGTGYYTTQESGHVPVFPVNVVDTTGAGDAFTAGVSVALGEGLALAEAVRFGNAVAGLCVTKPGTAPSMPYRAEVDALLNG